LTILVWNHRLGLSFKLSKLKKSSYRSAITAVETKKLPAGGLCWFGFRSAGSARSRLAVPFGVRRSVVAAPRRLASRPLRRGKICLCAVFSCKKDTTLIQLWNEKTLWFLRFPCGFAARRPRRAARRPPFGGWRCRFRWLRPRRGCRRPAGCPRGGCFLGRWRRLRRRAFRLRPPLGGAGRFAPGWRRVPRFSGGRLPPRGGPRPFVAGWFPALRVVVVRRLGGWSRLGGLCFLPGRFAPGLAGRRLRRRLCLRLRLLAVGPRPRCFAALSFFVAGGGFQPPPIITEPALNYFV